MSNIFLLYYFKTKLKIIFLKYLKDALWCRAHQDLKTHYFISKSKKENHLNSLSISAKRWKIIMKYNENKWHLNKYKNVFWTVIFVVIGNIKKKKKTRKNVRNDNLIMKKKINI